MNPDTIKNSIQGIVDGLTPLAQKLGVALTGVWGWALKHNYALAFEYVFGAIVGLVLAIIASTILVKSVKAGNEDDWDHDKYFVGTVIGVILTLAGIGLFLGCGLTAINRLVAPEWNTAMDISCLIHNCNSTNN